MTKKDLEDREDVALLIQAFYEKARQDEQIGFIFNEVVSIDWEAHFPIMYDFWEGVLFNKHHYKRNPIKIHQDLHLKVPLTKAHFDRWLALFMETIDVLFEGPIAEIAKTRALSIATIMQVKIN